MAAAPGDSNARDQLVRLVCRRGNVPAALSRSIPPNVRDQVHGALVGAYHAHQDILDMFRAALQQHEGGAPSNSNGSGARPVLVSRQQRRRPPVPPLPPLGLPPLMAQMHAVAVQQHPAAVEEGPAPDAQVQAAAAVEEGPAPDAQVQAAAAQAHVEAAQAQAVAAVEEGPAPDAQVLEGGAVAAAFHNLQMPEMLPDFFNDELLYEIDAADPHAALGMDLGDPNSPDFPWI